MTVCDQIGTCTNRQDRDRPRMGRKQPHTPEQAVAKLSRISTLVRQGMPVTQAVRTVGVSDTTYYRWRAARRAQAGQGGHDPDQELRLRRLEVENTRLRRAVADLAIEKQALKEATCGLA